MMLDIDTNTKIFEDFITFIEERALIYHKKEILKQPAPWTNDTILANGKFGNVWRQLDSGTRWETNKLQHNYHSPYDDMILILTYRHNLIPWVTETLMTKDYVYAYAYMVLRYKPVISDVIKIYPSYECTVRNCEHKLSDICFVRYVLKHFKDVKTNIYDFMQYKTF